MPRLDVRLIAVTKQIRASSHVDIGSDHGGMLVSLLESGRINYGIAIENHRQPYQNSVNALAGLPADVRFGDGLAMLKTGEAESLSICGMGASTMRSILEAFPDRVPDRVVLQPNRKPKIIRAWALKAGFHMVDEQIVYGNWGHCPYSILCFQRAQKSDAGELAPDPAYQDIDLDAAIEFGPLVLKRNEPFFQRQLKEEEVYWSKFERLEPRRVQRLALIRAVLANTVRRNS